MLETLFVKRAPGRDELSYDTTLQIGVKWVLLMATFLQHWINTYCIYQRTMRQLYIISLKQNTVSFSQTKAGFSETWPEAEAQVNLMIQPMPG